MSADAALGRAKAASDRISQIQTLRGDSVPDGTFDLETMGLSDRGDFAFERRGPWPQPAPRYPEHMAPAVTKLPIEMRLKWARHVGTRYVRDYATYWPTALAWAMGARGYRPVSNGEFLALFDETVLAKTRTETFDRDDDARLATLLSRVPFERVRLWKADFGIMRGVRPFEGLHTSATVVYGCDTSVGPTLLGIAVEDAVFGPDDGDAFELAKYFALQGAAYHILLTSHPLSHFPQDAINAITLGTLPLAHPLHRLLAPHGEFALRQNAAVLYSPRSIVQNDQRLAYTVLTGPTEGIRTLNPSGYAGIRGNRAYPAYRYPLGPRRIAGSFGRFVDAYFPPVLEFVETVLESVSPTDPHVARWANSIAGFIPGFPDSVAMRKPGMLARAVASYVFDVAIVHTIDHASFGKLPLDAVPLRIRVPAPRAGETLHLDRRLLATREDRFRAEMARRMFFEPRPVAMLHEVDYRFDEPEQTAAVLAFHDALREVDASFRGPKVLRWNEFASSIQF